MKVPKGHATAMMSVHRNAWANVGASLGGRRVYLIPTSRNDERTSESVGKRRYLTRLAALASLGGSSAFILCRRPAMMSVHRNAWASVGASLGSLRSLRSADRLRLFYADVPQ